MPRTRVKICGITETRPADVALEFGADALGFVFADSPRKVNAAQATALIEALPQPFVAVAVFKFVTDDDMTEVLPTVPVSVVQADEEESHLERDFNYSKAFLRVFRLGTSNVHGRLAQRRIQLTTQPILVEGPRSGFGETCDWSAAASLARQHRIILAGGLTPDNVAEAIRTVRPYGVDVSSGVESSPGKKDPIKIRDFLQAARDVDRELQ